jgi:excisionase family DNA binding protein
MYYAGRHPQGMARERVMVSDQWLTVAQAAEIVQVHPETLRAWLRSGRIPATLLSRRAGYRIRASDLEAFLSGGASASWGKETAAA